MGWHNPFSPSVLALLVSGFLSLKSHLFQTRFTPSITGFGIQHAEHTAWKPSSFCQLAQHVPTSPKSWLLLLTLLNLVDSIHILLCPTCPRSPGLDHSAKAQSRSNSSYAWAPWAVAASSFVAKCPGRTPHGAAARKEGNERPGDLVFLLNCLGSPS